MPSSSDALGGLFAAGLGAWLIYGPGRGSMPLDVGFALSMAIGFSQVILYWVSTIQSSPCTSTQTTCAGPHFQPRGSTGK